MEYGGCEPIFGGHTSACAHPGGFGVHPKMEKHKTLLVEHFAQKGFEVREMGNGAGDLNSDSRVVAFTSFQTYGRADH